MRLKGKTVKFRHGPAAVRGDEGAEDHWGNPGRCVLRMNPESENLTCQSYSNPHPRGREWKPK